MDKINNYIIIFEKNNINFLFLKFKILYFEKLK